MTSRRHIVHAGDYIYTCDAESINPSDHRMKLEPWIATLVQSEHLNILVGNGLTTAVANLIDVQSVSMSSIPMDFKSSDRLETAIKKNAKTIGRETPTIEDQIRVLLDVIGGLTILAVGEGEGPNNSRKCLGDCRKELDKILHNLIDNILNTEREINKKLFSIGDNYSELNGGVRTTLSRFLLAFCSRQPSRERTHIFTTNYDRLIERACDSLGIRLIDRFVGSIRPVYQSSRLAVDLHYNPPGLRGEPRYLDGVARITKLHGSLEWRAIHQIHTMDVIKTSLPFGAAKNHPEIPKNAGDQLLIFPNSVKDMETLNYPYADLFRDFSAAVCQPNSVLVTYGYGYGDAHINRIILDMLRVPSTHLLMISYNDPSGLIQEFLNLSDRTDQITYMVGPHFGDLSTLVEHYLPKPTVQTHLLSVADLLRRRALPVTEKIAIEDAIHSKIGGDL